MTKVKKTYRLEADAVELLQVEADKRGISATEAIQQAIRQYTDSEPYSEPYASHTLDKAFEMLEKQLEVKDEHIKQLNQALINAQALNAADKAPNLLDNKAEQEEAAPDSLEPPSLLERIKRFFI